MSTDRTDTFGSIAVVGATGAVGREALAILELRGIAASRITALASPRSAGSTIPYAGGPLRVESLDDFDFRAIDAAPFCAPSGVARAPAPRAVEAGALVVDNSSAFPPRPPRWWAPGSTRRAPPPPIG